MEDFNDEKNEIVKENNLNEKEIQINDGKKQVDEKRGIPLWEKIWIIIGSIFISIFVIKFTIVEIWNIERYIDNLSHPGIVDLKPIIYLYPEQKQSVSVKLGAPEKLTCTYPKYEGDWEVVAEPNGDLTDTKTGRKLYALYWEGKNTNSKFDGSMNEGFCIKGEDSAIFLEEKLKILGLNEREAEEFIVYWLPKLEKNKYNYIRFETMEEINENMPLDIVPKPDTVIRVMMEFKGLEDEIDVKEQKLETPARNGFVAVEWGGTELQ